MLVPCKNCEQRFFGCHSKCAEYEYFKADIKVVNAKRKQELDSGRGEWTQYEREKRKGRKQSNEI